MIIRGEKVYVEGEFLDIDWRGSAKIRLAGSAIVRVADFTKIVNVREFKESRVDEVRVRTSLFENLAAVRNELAEKNDRVLELELELSRVQATLDKTRAHASGVVVT